MIDFVISGGRGFVGSHLLRGLAADFRVCDDREFAATTEKARVFVHCANIPSSPSADIALLERQMDLAAGRAEIFVQPLSFATLDGKECAPHRFNCGLRPRFLNFYAAGKLAQERVLCARKRRGFSPAVCFLYLPAVIGSGGTWSSILEQARAFGYSLPRGLRASARANWIDVADFEKALRALCAKPAVAPVTRMILNRVEAEHMTWQSFLGDGQMNTREGASTWIKNAVTTVLLSAFAVADRLGMLVPAERLLRAAKPLPAYSGPTAAAPGQSPVRFDALSARLIARQPYFPPWD